MNKSQIRNAKRRAKHTQEAAEQHRCNSKQTQQHRANATAAEEGAGGGGGIHGHRRVLGYGIKKCSPSAKRLYE